MTLIKDASLQWSDPITVEEAEIWQVRSGSILLTTTATPDPDDGISLVLRDGIRVPAGSTISYRREGDGFAVIAREVI
jgi:hypothetical protein